jgi:hypothetical protein
MKETVSLLIIVLILISCSNKRIEIASDYIINENWSKKNDDVGGNSIKITKMAIRKDSIINPFSELNNREVLSKLEEDSLFRWYAIIKIDGGNYENRKIYFNKDNGFTWLDDVENKRTMIFGNLEKGSWYKFSQLVSYPYDIYIFIDSANVAHRFDINLANY